MSFLHRLIALPAIAVGFTALSVAPAGADPVLVFRDYFSQERLNLCNGELVTLQARVHVVLRQDGEAGFVQTVSTQAQGVGSSGNKYVFSGNFRYMVGDVNLVLTERERMISKGPAINTVVFQYFNAASGEIRFEPDCKG